MKIKVTKTETEEKEITLPLFYKLTYETLGSTYYAMFDEEKSIRIDAKKEITCISTGAVADGINKQNYVEITESEFTQAFEETMGHIQSLLPQHV